jgi:hypothetical protein
MWGHLICLFASITLQTVTYIHTYIHTYIYTFHGSIILSQDKRMWNKSVQIGALLNDSVLLAALSLFLAGFCSDWAVSQLFSQRAMQRNNFYLCKIWGSDSGVVEDSGLLRCDAVSLDEWFFMFWRIILPFKHQEPLIQWHSIISEKTAILGNRWL